MTDGRMDALPLLLRQEPFGGLLFIPNGAVHIELDAEGYLFVRDYLRGQRQLSTEDERTLMERIESELPGLNGRPVEIFDEDFDDLSTQPFRVYAAPTLVDFQITERCSMGCPHCYASSVADGRDVPLEEIELVLRELSASGVMQIALGGGEPLGHPQAIEILELCHAHNLVPSLTTNGMFLDADMLHALRKHCGAVALSLEGVGERFDQRRKLGFGFFQQCLQRLLEHGLSTVLQVTLSKESFGDLDDIVELCLDYPSLYGVIFLAYKEVGRGSRYHHVLSELDPLLVHNKLRTAFLTLSKHMRVGYDCCLTPAMVGLESDLGFAHDDQLEGCSAMRSSIGVLPNLDVTPCTFLPKTAVGNLHEQPLAAIWRGRPADKFRLRMAQQMTASQLCRSCTTQSECLGGCPAFDLVRCTQSSPPSA